MSLLIDALKRKNKNRPPVWMMRQAGRYHDHYQEMKKKYSFIELCKTPEAACETTMGPIRDFDFDAAILFSDILFPLEVMGMGLEYSPGPKLSFHLDSKEKIESLNIDPEGAKKLSFQSEALKLIRSQLPSEKGLIGFVGAPLTLYFYAAVGSHKGDLTLAKDGVTNGQWELFHSKLYQLLLDNMLLQARAGAEAIALFDTCGGEISFDHYQHAVVPLLKELLTSFKKQAPNTPIIYYSKKTTKNHWKTLVDLPIECIGVDWNTPITEVLEEFGDRFAIQGNFDPNDFFLDTNQFNEKLLHYFEEIKKLPATKREGWICGLGHGVLPKTPQEHVKKFVVLQKEIFG
ncbi:MAG: uroporphyrinogen decarboxylase [Bdellovibrionaceae bacterium]|nr:uroporphyrinogen decarboxylase [Pseudobdellovibrionaceae bacterium]|tara:strand:- start:201 stop:1238 length:1038 start_codon:yes stop_codon:yes gene_type:complete